MTARFLGGRRADGVFGVWASKEGFDATTILTDEQYQLAISLYTTQLILNGMVTSVPAFVPYSLSQTPFVFITPTNLTITVHQGSGGATTGYSSIAGMFVRPYPGAGASGAVQADLTPTGMTISGGSSVVGYAVYRNKLNG